MVGSRAGARRRYRSDPRVRITPNDMSDLRHCANELPTGEEYATISSQDVNAGLANELIEVLLNKENGNFGSFRSIMEKHGCNWFGERLNEKGMYVRPYLAV